MTPQRRMILVRRLKWGVYAFTAAAVLYLAWSYDFDRIPEGYAHLTPQKMPPGTVVVTTDWDDDLATGVGTVLVYQPVPDREELAYGVVAGVPGETIRFGDRSRGEPAAWVGGRAENLILPADHRIPAGVIPAGHYLVLNGDRALTSGTTHPDSRLLGLVPESRFRKKVLTALWFL